MAALFKRLAPFPATYVLAAVFIAIVAASLVAFKPQPVDRYNTRGDGSYWISMDVVKNGTFPADFQANRFVTGTSFIVFVVAVEKILGSREVAWMMANSLFSIGVWMCFYFLAERVLKNTWAAAIAALLLALNYDAVVWGLSFAADASGWFFFVAALYFTHRFLETREEKNIWYAAGLVAVGGTFKEYALCAVIAVSLAILISNGKSLGRKIQLLLTTGLLALAPFLLVNLWTWHTFHYTYLDWWAYNKTRQNVYPDSRLDEYIKIFGEIYNFAWFVFLPGVAVFWKRRKEALSNPDLQIILLAAAASLPAFIWPPLQRIFFIGVPAFALVVGLFLARMKRPWLVLPLVVVYALCGFCMDAYILPNVNIGPVLHAFIGR